MAGDNANHDNSAKVSGNGANQVSRDVTRTTLQILFIGLLIAAVAWVMRPFLTSIIWAGMIVITTWPVLLSLQARLWNKRWLATAIMTLALLVIVLGPISLAVAAMVRGADEAYFWVKSLTTFTLPSPPAWLASIPLAGTRLANLWSEIARTAPDELLRPLAPYAGKTLKWFVTQAGSVGMLVLQFFLTVIISAIFYIKGEGAGEGIGNFARRLAGKHGTAVIHLAERAIRGVALGVVVTALIQASIGGLGLIIVRVPGAAILTAVMFMLCLAQVGPSLIMIPAIIWVYWSGGPLWGTILLVFGVLTVTIDNVIRPFLIKKGADLPIVMIFAGVIGGLLAFGIIGLFIGPVVLAVAHILVKAWVSGQEDVEEGSDPTP